MRSRGANPPPIRSDLLPVVPRGDQSFVLWDQLPHGSVSVLGKGAPLPASNGAPNKKHDDRPNGRTNKTSTLSCAIPAESLPQKACDECSHDAQNCGQDETTRLVIAWSERRASAKATAKKSKSAPKRRTATKSSKGSIRRATKSASQTGRAKPGRKRAKPKSSRKTSQLMSCDLTKRGARRSDLPSHAERRKVF